MNNILNFNDFVNENYNQINEGNKEQYEKTKDAAIKELDKFHESFKTPLAKKVLSSAKSFFISFGSVNDENELKELKNKHNELLKNYNTEFAQLKDDMKAEGNGAIKRMFSSKVRETSYALNLYKKIMNYWKL